MTDTLQRRDVIRLHDGRLYRVEHVNLSRAHCRAVAGDAVTIGDRTFAAAGRELDISPHSCVEVVTRDKRIKG